MGSMYLTLNNAPRGDSAFSMNRSTIYPKGRFTGLAVVQKANAETRLGNLSDALKTFQDYLAKNPPAEVAVIAQAGVAGIHKDNRKWDDAIAAYNVVKTKYPGTPQAIEADYWIGICTQQKGDNAAAAPILDAFAKANPQHALAPLALYAKGGALIALGKKDEGIAALASVAEQYPDSQPAPFTYFMRAQLRASEGKANDVVALMRQFIEKYPKNDKVYFAYESIAQTADQFREDRGRGSATYREFIESYPDSPQAGDALFKIAELQRAKADSLGRYSALAEQERSQWKTLLDSSIASAEEAIKEVSRKRLTGPGAANPLAVPAHALGGRTEDRVSRSKSTSNPWPTPPPVQTRDSKILFALANYVSEQDEGTSSLIMNEAYQHGDCLFAAGTWIFTGSP